jgi:hypothetical protein
MQKKLIPEALPSADKRDTRQRRLKKKKIRRVPGGGHTANTIFKKYFLKHMPSV